MKWDLKRPCTICPFKKEPGVIRFACRERAEEIEQIAYRQGFVCHEHSTYLEDSDGSGHFDFGEDGEQHCVGALLMYMDSDGNVPYQQLDESEQARIAERIDWLAPHYDDETEFLDSYGAEE